MASRARSAPGPAATAFDRARKALFEEGISRRGCAWTRAARRGGLLDAICAGVRRACTYAGARTIRSSPARAVVGMKSAAGFTEGKPRS